MTLPVSGAIAALISVLLWLSAAQPAAPQDRASVDSPGSAPSASAVADLPIEQALARRTAAADAYRKLARALGGLRAVPSSPLREWAAESQRLSDALDAALARARLDPPQWLSSGVCEVRAELQVSAVVDALRVAIAGSDYVGSVSNADIDALAAAEQSTIQVTGRGGPREELPPGLPVGVLALLGTPPGVTAGAAPAPEIWRTAGSQGRQMAVRAARLDALRRLCDQILAARLTRELRARDLLPAADALAQELSAHLGGAREVGPPYLHHDELIAEVEMRVGATQARDAVLRIIQLHAAERPDRAQLREAAQRVFSADRSAVGMGIPPRAVIEKHEQSSRRDLPAWASEPIEVVGTARDPEASTPLGRLRAARSAEADARGRLAERVRGLAFAPNRLVGELIRGTDSALLLDDLIAEALVVGTRFENGTASVTVQLAGMRVWEFCNEHDR